MDWGWNPDTVVAIATFLAMLAATAAGIFAGISFVQMKKQAKEAARQTELVQQQAEAASEQLKIAQTAREREHAESIAAWTEFDGDDLIVVVQNRSFAPIYDVRLASCLGTRSTAKYYYAARKTLVPPSSDRGYIVNPGVATTANLAEWVKRHPKNPHPPIDIIFFDKFGIQWRRDRFGQLEPYESSDDIPVDWLDVHGRPLTSKRDPGR